MDSLNQTFFLWLNAPEHPSALALTLAIFFAERLIWAIPLLIGIGWLRGSETSRKTFTQLCTRRYTPWIYWLTVLLVSMVGTQITDLLTDGLGVSLYISTSAPSRRSA